MPKSDTKIRKRRSPEESRNIILDVAEKELIKSDGALEMSQLAKKAGLSEGLPYHYFKNRAGVIAAVADRFFDRYEAEIIDVGFDGATWQAREKARVKSLVDFYVREKLTPVIFSRLGNEPEVVEVMNRRSKRQIDLAARNISDAQEVGDIPKERDPRLLGALMLGAIQFALTDYWREEANRDPEHLCSEIWVGIEALSNAGGK